MNMSGVPFGRVLVRTETASLGAGPQQLCATSSRQPAEETGLINDTLRIDAFGTAA